MKPKCFSRDRKLTLPISVLLLINFFKSSYSTELKGLFKAISRSDADISLVSRSAFCQARKNIRPKSLAWLNKRLVSIAYGSLDLKTWHSHHLVAIDGTTFRFGHACPKLRAYFGVDNPKRAEPRTMARASQAYDPLNNITLDGEMRPYKVSELTMAKSHLKNLDGVLPDRSLFLLDRNYVTYKFCNQIADEGHFFCLRAKCSMTIVKQLEESAVDDLVVDWRAHKDLYKELREQGIPLEMRARVLAIDVPTKDTESSTEKMFLVTNLIDKGLYPYEEFSALYHLRWGVEEDYKVKKCRLDIERWSGKSVNSAYQDFYATIFAQNLTSLLTRETEEQVKQMTRKRKWKYKLNFTAALSEMKDNIVLLLLRKNPTKRLLNLFASWVTELIPIRPGRHYPRKGYGRKKNGKSKNQPKLQHNAAPYKPLH